MALLDSDREMQLVNRQAKSPHHNLKKLNISYFTLSRRCKIFFEILFTKQCVFENTFMDMVIP